MDKIANLFTPKSITKDPTTAKRCKGEENDAFDTELKKVLQEPGPNLQGEKNSESTPKKPDSIKEEGHQNTGACQNSDNPTLCQTAALPCRAWADQKMDTSALPQVKEEGALVTTSLSGDMQRQGDSLQDQTNKAVTGQNWVGSGNELSAGKEQYGSGTQEPTLRASVENTSSQSLSITTNMAEQTTRGSVFLKDSLSVQRLIDTSSYTATSPNGQKQSAKLPQGLATGGDLAINETSEGRDSTTKGIPVTVSKQWNGSVALRQSHEGHLGTVWHYQEGKNTLPEVNATKNSPLCLEHIISSLSSHSNTYEENHLRGQIQNTQTPLHNNDSLQSAKAALGFSENQKEQSESSFLGAKEHFSGKNRTEGQAFSSQSSATEQSFSFILGEKTQNSVLDSQNAAKTSPSLQHNQFTEDLLFDQVIQKIRTSSILRDNKLVMRLHPEELGTLKLDIQIKDGLLNAHILAQSKEVQHILERNMTKLKTLLGQQGVQVESFSIALDKDSDPTPDFLGEHTGKEQDNNFQKDNKFVQNLAIASQKEEEIPAIIAETLQPGVRIRI